MYSAPASGGLSSDSDHELDEDDRAENNDVDNEGDIETNTSSDSSHGEEDTGRNVL